MDKNMVESLDKNLLREKEKPLWWKEAAFYQIYPRSFKDSNGDGVGDLAGVTQKLDYLKELGVDAVWISPMYQSPMVDNGYDISDYEAIEPIFGTMEDFEKLRDGLHLRGIKLMMDLVINHTSSEHPWFVEARSSRDNPKRNWYIWHDGKTDESGERREPNNWGSAFGGSAWKWDEKTKQYYLHLFSEGQPDLNWRNPEVKEAIFSMMRRWIARGIDGFRVDVGHLYLKHPEFPDALHEEADAVHASGFVFPRHMASHQKGLHELYQEMREKVLGPDIAFFGEMYDFEKPEDALRYVEYSRGEFDLLYQYPVVHARGDWSKAKQATRQWYETFKGKGWNSITFSNHDSARPTSIFGDDITAQKESAKLIATYLFTVPGTPFFLQGEELGMTNTYFSSIEEYNDAETRGLYEDKVEAGEDPALVLEALAPWSRDNARTPMQWHGGEHAGFSETTPWLQLNPHFETVNVEVETSDPTSVLSYYKHMIALRKKYKTLVYGDFVPLTHDEENPYAYVRQDEHETFLIIMNTSSDTQRIPEVVLKHTLWKSERELCAQNCEEIENEEMLSPWEARVYRVR